MMCGGSRVIEHTRRIIKNKDNITKCSECDGRGQKVNIVQMGPGMISQQVSPCRNCSGSGNLVEYEQINEILEVHIERGSKKGDMYRFEGKAHEEPNISVTGDLVVIFGEESTNVMQRQGDNLVILKKVLLSEALTGLEVAFEHPNKKTILIKDDAIIKPDQVKVVRGLGFPIKDSMRVGDLVIKFEVVFPDDIDIKKKELIHKLLPKDQNRRMI